MPPGMTSFPRNESIFHKDLTKEDREELLQLQSLREIPKSRYATQSCVTALPSDRQRRAVYSHIEIYKMVEDIATDLREAGVRPQTICAFALNNCIESIVYFQALMWIGAIALPIDPNLSEEHITAILKDSHAFTVVSAFVDDDERADDQLHQKIHRATFSLGLIEWFISRSTNKGVFLVRNGIRAGEGAAWAGGAGDFKFDPAEIAVRFAQTEGNQTLVFDSSHRRLASATREFAKVYNLSAEMSTLLVFPLHTINGLMCMLGTMYSGGNVIVPTGSSIDAKSVLKHVTEQDAKWFCSDPDLILGVYDEITKDSSIAEKIKLCFIRSIGKNIEPDTMRTIEPVLRAPVLEAYGSAEVCGLVSANEDFDFRPGTFGKPISTCTVVILNDIGEKVAAGTVGKIAVRGEHVMRGYNENDYANGNSFVEVSQGDETFQYFLTGDEGSLSTDEFLKVTTVGVLRRNRPEVDEAAEAAMASQVALETEKTRRKAAEIKKKMAEEERLEEERKAEAERLKKEREEKEERLTKEREERLKKEEKEDRLKKEKSGEEERLKQEMESRRLQEEEEKSRSLAESEAEKSRSKSSEDAMATRSVSIPARDVEHGMNSEVLDRILERLAEIEKNQHRLEHDFEKAHRTEMERLRELFDKLLEKDLAGDKSVVNVNMDAINSAVTAAAASAQSSSRDTAMAAQAAREAAEAAASASRLAESQRDVVEVVDPGSVQKTVLVSLEEIEEAMLKHPAVATARAFGRPDERYGTEVFCAINPLKGARVSEPWLKLHAQSVLPAAFVPKKFFYKGDLTGVEDRAALASDTGLQRMAAYGGFGGGTKTIQSPSWSPKTGETAGQA